MKRPQEILADETAMNTISLLTNAFQGLASMKISQIKDQVLQTQHFFDELWEIYQQLRVDSLFRFGRDKADAVIDKDLIIAITAEGGFSGDIDQRLIRWMLKEYDPKRHEIIIIGHHGAMQLTQNKIAFKKYYKLPDKDSNINVKPLIREVRQYRSTVVYYQTYLSLSVQDIKHIELGKAVQEAGMKAGKVTSTVISPETYIFEPSTLQVVAYLERSMLEIALSQAILDSKLAQYASRFRAMSVAYDRASESKQDLRILYNRSKRAIADTRLKEIMSGRKNVH